MSESARAVNGTLHLDDGTVRPARFYIGEGERDPVEDELIDPECHATWIEDDGAIGIRRGTSVTPDALESEPGDAIEISWGN